ncbi:MAG: carboxy terminal-processing peptidase [Verrucomicrobia bacterium]|nr:carboxy terminal-processing peptidase [Verrucomicrobiota bacterium]
MHHPIRFARGLFLMTALAAFVPQSPAQSERAPNTSPTLGLEIRALIHLLEEVHYNRDAVRPASYADVIPDYMSDLDGQRLFFLGSDKRDFVTRYKPDALYWNIASLGKIEPAYDVFAVYKQRVTDRVAWISDALKKDINLATKDTYILDRTKAEWPATAAEADDLWAKRLRFEVIKELLNKKPLEEAKTNVRKRYERMLKNMADIESSDLSEMFLTSIAHLYDPHSNYFSANTYEDFGIQMRLQLVGIGALLGIEEDQCVIKEIIPGGPADLDKKLKPNDKIVAVAQDGSESVEVIGMKLRKIVDMIRGAKGTRVHLLVEPAEGASSVTRKEIVLTRDVVNLDSARAHAAIFEVPDTDGKTVPIGVITLPAFYGPDMSGNDKAQNSATKDIAELIKRLQAANIKGLVLDLRRNGGGLLSEAISLTGLFIKQGPVVQVRSYYGDIKVDDDDDPAVAYDGPLAVLVSRFSASASEIVAGALQNYGRAVIVGDSSTHGKGSVQTVVEMKNVIPQLARSPEKSGATKLTVQKFYLPSGSSTQLKGVVPDIVLPSVDDYLPIGETDLPHALAWDEIPSSTFDGKPLPASVLLPLRTASQGRQAKLPEFDYLKRAITWFKERQDQKAISLNLKERTQQKEEDAAFKKKMDSERKHLAEADYKFTEVMLAPPPPPRIKADKKDDDGDNGDDALLPDENERYIPVDIPLRESLRVLTDELHLNPSGKESIDRAARTAQAASAGR